MRLMLWFTYSLAVRISPSWTSSCGASEREVTLSNPVMSSLAVCYPDLFRVLELAFTMPLSKHISCTHSSQNKLDRCLYHDLHCWIWVTNTVLALSEISRCLNLSHKPSSWICDAFYVSHLRMFISSCCSSGTWCPCIVGCVRFYSDLIWHWEWWHCSCAACVFPRQAIAVLNLTFVCCQVDAWIDDAISCESKVWIAVDRTEGLA